MDRTIAERRHDPRIPSPATSLVHMILRPGCPVALVNISAGGAEVESDRPLGPGTRVHARLVSRYRTLATAALVLRSAVSAIRSDDGVIYRAAVRFEERCPQLEREVA